MWQSATVAAVTLLEQPHLLAGGLGGVIAVIVGGVVSVITLRNAKRNAPRPAPNPQPAPVSRRSATPPGYGQPAPPTAPSRRLHPGPISLSEPAQPQRAADDEDAPGALFNPDIFSSDSSDSSDRAEPDDTLASLIISSPPVLRPHRSLAAEWRAQATPTSGPDLLHAPIWNRTPFARPDTGADALAETPITSDVGVAIEPPIWRAGSLSERLRLASAPAELTAPSVEPGEPVESVESFAARAPIWPSWLHAPSRADDERQPEMRGAEEEFASEPPIWPSYLRRD